MEKWNDLSPMLLDLIMQLQGAIMHGVTSEWIELKRHTGIGLKVKTISLDIGMHNCVCMYYHSTAWTVDISWNAVTNPHHTV